MHTLQTIDALYQHSPDLLLFEINLHVFPLLNHLEQVAVIGIGHDDAEHLTVAVDEGFSV